MNLFEYAIARTHFQLIAESAKRTLTEKETRLLKNLTPSVESYEARETRTAKSGRAGATT